MAAQADVASTALPMPTTFISHSSKDAYFVSLLVALLDYHGIPAWCSTRNISPGARFRPEIGAGLRKADALIVVISDNAVTSKWMQKEIVTYQTARADALIIPILLDDTDPGAVADGLGEHQRIDFTTDMRSGFVNLFAVLGSNFLPLVDRREVPARRSKLDRRAWGDRRGGSTVKRMRIGFWKAFAQRVDSDKFREYYLTVRNFARLEDALSAEASRYQYQDAQGAIVLPAVALRTAIDAVRAELSDRSFLGAVYLVEDVAVTLDRLYGVDRIDRRQASTRREDQTRRTAVTDVRR